jgi:RimJ/RimL family protein N-acetyltransferase
VKVLAFLRRAERDDLDTVVEWMEDPDFQLFLYGDPARSPKQVRERIINMLGRTASNMLPGGIYLIVDHREYGPVGLAAFQSISWRNRSCNVDLYIGRKDLRSSIVAASTMYRAFEYAFDELNMHRIGAYIYSFNRPSWRLLERSGAVRELTLREQVARDGKLHDMYCYGLLRDEFNALREELINVRGISLADMVAELHRAAESTEAPT